MDQNNKHAHHGGGYASGFLLGVIVGAALVFLLVTKKGKKILSVLTENGLEGISEITDMFDDDQDLEEEEAVYTAEGDMPKKSPARSLKRFFKRIKK